MNNLLTRRRFAAMAGGAAGVAATMLAHADTPAPAAPQHALQQTPWPYQPLDPDAVAQRGYEANQRGGCMYGVVYALAGTVAERLGAPYTEFPFEIFRYGGGGVNGWGTLCGTLNGAAAAFQLLSPAPAPLVDALFAWYEAEPLPNIVFKGQQFKEVRSVAASPLCHASIANWTEVSGKSSYSPERAERCGALVASVARKAAQMLNDQKEKRPLPFKLSEQTHGCMSCHEKGGLLENVRAKMECVSCHQTQAKDNHGGA